MSHSVRFLTMALAGWAAVRAITLGLDPQHQALAATAAPGAVDRETRQSPAQPPQPPEAGTNVSRAHPYGWQSQPYPPYPYPPYAYWPAPPPAAGQARPVVIRVEQAAASPLSAPPPWAYAAMPSYQYAPTSPDISAPPVVLAPPSPSATPTLGDKPTSWLDRFRGYSWVHYRQARGTVAPPGLAPVGTLGGSQAGARLLFRLAPRLDASARYTSAIGSLRGSEAALGVRYQPFAGVPLAVTAERRQRIDGIGRSDFALFAEGGFYGRKLAYGFTADGNVQAGVVGLKSRDWFADAQMTATRPLFNKVSIGGGVWTAAQPGLSRFDIGPRVSIPLAKGFRLDSDYRLNVAGNAAPGDGPTITVAGDF